MYHPTSRVLTVLELLQSRPSMSGPELAARLEMDVRTVCRYITHLQDVGISVEANIGRYGGYRLRPGFKLPPLMLTEEEATAVMLGLLGTSWLEIGQSSIAVEGALAKVSRVLPQHARDRLKAMSAHLFFFSAQQEARPDISLVIRTGVSAQGRTVQRRFPILKVALISSLIVLAMGFLALSVFAQPASHLTPIAKHPTQGPLVPHTAPTARPTRTVPRPPTPTLTTATTQATPPSDWVPSALTLQQLGWTGAGLSTGDALEAERTAWTFTDREMSLDYRNGGTRAQHGGTFTAAVFLLTPNARVRFIANDVREINNTLFDRVQQQQLIQEVINAQPRLVRFQVQGQQEFAWVDGSFQLWQSQLDQQTGSRVEGLELDPATNGPRVHHMIVLLLRVTPGTQGANAPMGGTGWLVSTYVLDPAGGSLPAIIQPA